MKKKSIIIASCVALGAIIFSCLGFSGILKQKSKNTNYADWMSHLADSTSLRDINMPGSHDTMALYSIADLAGQCQSLTLGDQLNLGVRFLDIRLKEENNSLKAVHGFIDQHASFSDITSTVESFLENHPTEFIIMSIKEEADSSKSTISFEEAVKKSSNLNDAVRYTSILDEDNFTSGYFAIKSNLEAKGYKEVRCKNFYDGFENGTQCQKAVQCVYQDKNGYKFELQFHTASSQGAKMGLNHKRYEKFRLNTTSKKEKNRLWDEMREIGKAVKNPEGVMKIKSHSEL